MIIVVAGIKRSCSTGQFNIIRLALRMAGYKVNVCGHGYQPRAVPKGEADLVKRHPFSKDIADAADYIFLTDRDNRAIIESMKRFNGSDITPEKLKDMRAHMNKWGRYNAHTFTYVNRTSPFAWIRPIIKILGLSVSADRVARAFKQVNPPRRGQDPKTLLFSNHITQ